ncbi:hypothetical protein GETHPA_23310 [Geothrix rubra]|uniref:Uncharacterized protein n=1 Tax=Geothrix rubra TaxID=2927977 RepID=A0ABQ5Q8Q4_9BACT|nr:hypothetical protein [Geothrix rubra]GLH70798.1 hypothetical protein GETHPA_23310 [Geothrix rubra]
MPSFKILKPIPSCNVDIKLLRLIEYLYSDFCKQYLLTEVDKNDKRQFSIRIIDSIGTEVFHSVDSIIYEKFPDEIKRIDVDLDAYNYDLKYNLRIELKFTLLRSSSILEIYFSGNEARSASIAMCDKIMQAIKSKENDNSLYNPTNNAGSLIFSISFAPFVLIIPLSKFSLKLWFIVFYISISLWVYLYFGKKLKPYCLFDTPKNDRKTGFANWFIFGLIGFFLFGTILTLARRQILGF